MPPLLLVLDGITDPHNLGACLRVADGAGVHAVVAPKDRAAGIGATVEKVASGAAETVPYITVTNLARTLRELQERDIQVVGTTDDAPRSIYDVDQRGPVAWVLGAEGEGMRRLTRETCDTLVHIPMRGAVESLNVSVASGVCLYETRAAAGCLTRSGFTRADRSARRSIREGRRAASSQVRPDAVAQMPSNASRRVTRNASCIMIRR